MPDYDNSEEVLRYGVVAASASGVSSPASASVATSTSQILMAGMSGGSTKQQLASVVAHVVDALHPQLSRHLQYFGEDFVWGIYAHLVLQIEVEARAPMALVYKVRGEWSTVRICQDLGVQTKWQSGDGFVDLALVDGEKTLVRIAEIKPDKPAQRQRAVEQISRYKRMIEQRLGRNTVLFGNAGDFLMPSTFQLGPFLYSFIEPGVVVYQVPSIDELEKLVDDLAKQLEKSVDDIVKFIAVLLLILAALATGGGALIPAIT
jgi:hypothetical protein